MILMNNQIIKVVGLTIAFAVVSACDTDFRAPVGDDSSFSSGSADFSKFVSIGDSLTAGIADGTLYRTSQENSYPAILAKQFAMVGGGSFEQPLVGDVDNLGGLLFNGVVNPTFSNRLVFDAATSSPGPIAGNPTIEVIGSGLNGSMFNNMGVPSAKSFHLGAPNYGDAAGLAGGTANPYFVRFASSATTTVITDAAVQQPSFFVLWIGNNDVLSYATAGGIGVDQKGNTTPTSYGSNDITDPDLFADTYAGLVGAMTAANADAKGVLINIPDVSTIPYFTTVPHNPVPFKEEDQASVDALNAAYAAYNGGLAAAQGLGKITAEEVARRTISFSVGQNAVVIDVVADGDDDMTNLTADATVPLPSYRQATADDLLVLPSSAKIGTEAVPGNPATVHGLGVPLGDGDVLIPSEILAINTARLAFNAAIKTAADANANLIHVDAAAVMAELNDTGISYGTGFVESTYVTGGAFSLDGVHPTARGYAVISNIIIDAINTGFGANIPTVDPGESTTIFFK